MQTDTEIAPPIALCAVCNCLCGGEHVTVSWEFDRIARAELPVFRHATAGQCVQARARAASFWTGARPAKQVA
jgi:hypothetical protein